jgi:CBS-domain-containing membrane protein
MKLRAFIHYLTAEPIQLSLHQKCLAVVSCLGAIWLTSGITQFYAPINAPFLIASMGASAVILFGSIHNRVGNQTSSCQTANISC